MGDSEGFQRVIRRNPADIEGRSSHLGGHSCFLTRIAPGASRARRRPAHRSGRIGSTTRRSTLRGGCRRWMRRRRRRRFCGPRMRCGTIFYTRYRLDSRVIRNSYTTILMYVNCVVEMQRGCVPSRAVPPPAVFERDTSAGVSELPRRFVKRRSGQDRRLGSSPPR